MNKTRQYYLESLAKTAYQAAKESGINLNHIGKEEALKVLEYYEVSTKGLKENEECLISADVYAKRIKGNKEEDDIIVYYRDDADNLVMKLLSMLGILLIEAEEVDKDIYLLSDSDMEAKYFARVFLMPEEKLRADLVSHVVEGGKFDILALAKQYGISFMDVLARGEDLKMWV